MYDELLESVGVYLTFNCSFFHAYIYNYCTHTKMCAFHLSSVSLLVRPRDGEELLPPPGGDVRDVEAEHERQRDEVEEGVKVLHHHLEQAEKTKREIF